MQVDPRDGARTWNRTGHLGAVLAVADHPQGTLSLGEDRTYRVWGPQGERRELRQTLDD